MYYPVVALCFQILSTGLIFLCCIIYYKDFSLHRLRNQRAEKKDKNDVTDACEQYSAPISRPRANVVIQSRELS